MEEMSSTGKRYTMYHIWPYTTLAWLSDTRANFSLIALDLRNGNSTLGKTQNEGALAKNQGVCERVMKV